MMLCYLYWLRWWLALYAPPEEEEHAVTWEAFMLAEVEDGRN